MKEVVDWIGHKSSDTRAIRAEAKVQFEHAWAKGDLDHALELARTIHVLLLAQRLRKGKRWVSAGETQPYNS
jgi:predicted ATPase